MYALDNIKVVSIENGVSAPLCTRMLADLGAEVVKVERPGQGDVHRQWDSMVDGHSAYHVWLDRNKQSIELDLKADAGREIFLDLAEKADIVVQNFSPGVVDRLGIGYDDVRELNEDVIYINISGYGKDGEYSDRKAYDVAVQGEAGLILMNGHPEAPAKIPLSICDINAGMYGALSALTALFHYERTGEGQEANVDMFTGTLSWLGYYPFQHWHRNEQPKRAGMRHHVVAPYGPHKTSDGQYVNFAVSSQSHWETFCMDVIERPDLLDDPRFESNEKRVENREVFEPIIEEIFANKPRNYWAERLDDAELPWGDVNTIEEVLNHPQTVDSNSIRTMDTDVGEVKYIDNPIDLSEIELRRNPFPKLGEHTDELLSELGYTPEEIERFRDSDVV